MMRCCKTCGDEKPLTEFYAHPASDEGRSRRCKECTKLSVRRHRRDPANVERIRAYDRERAKTPERVARQIIVTREYRLKYPERYKANTALNNAIRDGRLFKEPCFTCGELQVEAHHYDYSRPLSVSWLCAVHHKEIHLLQPDPFEPSGTP